MKRIALVFLFTVLSAAAVCGQDAATQQQLDKLTGQIQDLLAAQGKQDQVLADLRREIGELRDKVNTPQINDSASRDDLKKLAEQVQEIDRKREDDKELILKNLEKIAKGAGDTAPVHSHKPAPKPADDTSTPAPATPQTGYEYPVKAGDTLSLIVKGYRDQGVKVTTTQVLKANPGLDPNKLYVGKKIFIPDPNAK